MKNALSVVMVILILFGITGMMVGVAHLFPAESKQELQIKEDGYQAGLHGVPVEACPFGIESDWRGQKWREGWINGFKVKNKIP